MAIDFETSGYYAHSACAIGLARVEDGRVTATFYSLIRPPSSRIYFSRVHGLTWKDLKNAPTLPEIWPNILAFIGDASFLLAHNASFDRNVLLACGRAFSIRMPAWPFLCTLKGSRKVLKISSRSLDSVCAHFGLDLRHHHAESDAIACALIFSRLLDLGVNPRDMLLAPRA